MRNTILMNGGLIGFGIGFIASGLALMRLVADYIPSYAESWYLLGIVIIGGIGLAIGIGFEVYERIKLRKQQPEEE